MKVISYNVNGIRAAIRKGFIDWFKSTDCDVLCLQELKASKEQVPVSLFEDLGYKYHFWHSATSRKGYSGVAIISRIEPQKVLYGYDDNKESDPEGRIIQADFENISVLSVYMPSGTRSEERRTFKLNWHQEFGRYMSKVKEEKKLLICGDYNIAHTEIDIHNPKSNVNTSGFLPEERDWLTQFLDLGFIDTFRHLNEEPHNYTWWSMRSKTAREKNLGWRIDYQCLSEELKEELKRAIILPEAKHSDHCPTLVEVF